MTWLLLAAILLTSAASPPLTGQAIVTDGDTLRIGDTRIQLFGID